MTWNEDGISETPNGHRVKTGAMSTSMIDAPCPSNDHRFVVEAGNQDLAGQDHYERERLVDHERHRSRTAASRAARLFLQRGLWFEVYDDDIKELPAQPPR